MGGKAKKKSVSKTAGPDGEQEQVDERQPPTSPTGSDAVATQQGPKPPSSADAKKTSKGPGASTDGQTGEEQEAAKKANKILRQTVDTM